VALLVGWVLVGWLLVDGNGHVCELWLNDVLVVSSYRWMQMGNPTQQCSGTIFYPLGWPLTWHLGHRSWNSSESGAPYRITVVTCLINIWQALVVFQLYYFILLLLLSSDGCHPCTDSDSHLLLKVGVCLCFLCTLVVLHCQSHKDILYRVVRKNWGCILVKIYTSF